MQDIKFKMRNISVLFLLLLTIFIGHVNAQTYMAGESVGNHLPPLPATVANIPNIKQSLDGNWEINMSPSAQSVSDYRTSKEWRSIIVPGELKMQGFNIKTDIPFTYRKKINISNTAKENLHIIRFNGVYSHAKVYFNGHFVREHFGGFTAWDANITPFIKKQGDNWLHVVVTDRVDDISYASGYAQHPIGGILRKVDYVILPNNPVAYLYVKAGLTKPYADGTLTIKTKIPNALKVSASYTLSDASGKNMVKRTLKLNNNVFVDSTVIPTVTAWTAENPYRYTLTLSIHQNGKLQQTFVEKVGFRSVELTKANELLINGTAVKLRGACRHDMHPLLGRMTNRQQDSLDVMLAKEANMNFIRTSHYPASEDFLEFCDKYGLYVQEETAVCFVREGRKPPYAKHYKTMDDPAYTDRYLGQLSEMIDRDRNHASIIMWSIGNESDYGTNFQKSYDFVKAIDPERPVCWSFPFTAFDKGQQNFDILVSHYPDWNREKNNLRKYEHMKGKLPMLADEWAHVSCYNTDLSVYDPNVKDFWGRSLDSLWIYSFKEKSYMGGAVWGMIDEIFHLKEATVGYGPWGIIDVWRRKKPEFWNTRKAYSPVRLLLQNMELKNGMITVPVHNRFDHTNLAAIKAIATINGQKSTIPMPNVAPHGKGNITLPATAADSTLLLQFKDTNGILIDEELISWKATPTIPALSKNGMWTIADKGDKLALKSNHIEVHIDKKTGKIIQAAVNGKAVITGNPLLVINKPEKPMVRKNAVGIFSGDYQIDSFSFDSKSKNVFVVTSKGSVDKYPVEMTVSLYPNGQIEVKYTADSIPNYSWDIGIGVPVSAALDHISWNRKGYWSTYPQDEISALTGSAVKTANSKEEHGVEPAFAMAQAMKDYVFTKQTDSLYRETMPATESYRAKKENIYKYTLSGNNNALTVWSNGKQSAKMNVQKDGSQQLLVSDKWDYWTLSWGNYQGTRNTKRKTNGTIMLQLSTTN